MPCDFLPLFAFDFAPYAVVELFLVFSRRILRGTDVASVGSSTSPVSALIFAIVVISKAGFPGHLGVLNIVGARC